MINPTDLFAQLGKDDLLIPKDESHWYLFLSSAVAILTLYFACWIYKKLHPRPLQNYIQTLVLVGLVTTVITTIASSYITNVQGKFVMAFILVGALSVIRFRVAMKNPLDVAFFFWVGGIGIGAGSIYYENSIAFYVVGVSFFIGIAMWAIHYLGFFTIKENDSYVLTVRFNAGVSPEKLLSSSMDELFDFHDLLSKESTRKGHYVEAVFNVRPKPHVDGQQVLSAISQINDKLKVIYKSAN